ncbi:14487_t:CDS:2, partial [Funneliformis geosporum]
MIENSEYYYRQITAYPNKSYADIEEVIDLYAQIPTFYPDYKPIINQMPPKEITEKSDQIEQYLHNKLIVYNNAKSQKAFLYSMDTGMQTEN